MADQSYRPALAAADAFLRALLRIAPGLARLDAEAIIAAARRQTGLRDLGPPDHRPALDQLLAVLNAAPLTGLGRVAARATIQKALVNRLCLAEYARQHVDLDDVPLPAPVFIVGFPRTGTTTLQNLLSLDPGARHLQFFELQTPVPVDPRPAVDRRRRLLSGAISLKAAYFVAPEMAQIHEVSLTSAEECWPLFFNTFHVLNYDMQGAFVQYGDWLLAQDLRPAYAEYRQALQVLAHGRPPERLVLKCPEHLWFIDALIDVFPDAKIIWTHRDPFECVASYCSLISLNHRLLYGQVDAPRVGAHVEDRFLLGVERAMASLDRAEPGRFFHVDFRALVRDPLPVLAALKAWAGLPHGPASEARAAAWLAADRADKPGQHAYEAQRFGVDAARVHKRYQRYIDRFSIPLRAG